MLTTHRPRARGVVVVGASAGGVEALVQLVRSLPRDFPLPVLVVLHIAPTGTSMLPAILDRASACPARSPLEGEEPLAGHVYVAPPDTHMLVDESVLRLSQAPRENGHRPAIDPTMRTAATAYGAGTIGIVLSGSRDDGTAGLLAVKSAGGLAVVQDPEEALYEAMPRSALEHVDVDAVLPIDEMAPWIVRQVEGDRPPQPAAVSAPDRAVGNRAPAAVGDGTRFTCPDCGGVLFERHEGALERFACSVGHVFSLESLSNAQADALEVALWAAVRSLEDRAALLRRSCERARAAGRERAAATMHDEAAAALARAATSREAIQGTLAYRAQAAEA